MALSLAFAKENLPLVLRARAKIWAQLVGKSRPAPFSQGQITHSYFRVRFTNACLELGSVSSLGCLDASAVLRSATHASTHPRLETEPSLELRERALLLPQSARSFTALARLSLFARPTKTTQSN